jgi:hypothetical protein
MTSDQCKIYSGHGRNGTGGVGDGFAESAEIEKNIFALELIGVEESI